MIEGIAKIQQFSRTMISIQLDKNMGLPPYMLLSEGIDIVAKAAIHIKTPDSLSCLHGMQCGKGSSSKVTSSSDYIPALFLYDMKTYQMKPPSN